jgi:hypothetical protein
MRNHILYLFIFIYLFLFLNSFVFCFTFTISIFYFCAVGPHANLRAVGPRANLNAIGGVLQGFTPVGDSAPHKIEMKKNH